jgi:putative ABC transport system permease protein
MRDRRRLRALSYAGKGSRRTVARWTGLKPLLFQARLDRMQIPADARFAFRYFGRHKATTAIILSVIALATGANAMIFSVFQAQFVRPAPAVRADDAMARIWARQRATRAASWEPAGFSSRELGALTGHNEIFQSVAAWTSDEIALDARDSTGALSTRAQFVTPNYFAVLGVGMSAGSGLRPDLSAVLSYAMAERLYGSAAAAPGHAIRVNDVAVQVVGVAPPRFQGALRDMGEPAVWLPVGARAEIAHVSPRWISDEAALSLVARLAPGVSRERATALAKQSFVATLPDSATRVGMARTADVIGLQSPPPGTETSEELVGFTVMLAVGGLILLVGWTNVSSLMVAAAVGRRHEIAVRLSLGASRPRVLRQLVTESTMLALAGAAVGLTMAWWTLAYMSKTGAGGVDVTPDLATFAFVLVMALTTGVLFGLSPALHATRTGVANALRDSGAGTSHRGRLQRGFVVAQIALSQPLLVMLGVMLSMIVAEYKPLSAAMSSKVIAVELRPLANGASAQRPEAVDSLLPRIAERAEVLAAVPDVTGFEIRSVAGHSGPTIVHLQGTAPGWFSALEVPIVLGRDISMADTADASFPVVIGSDAARAVFGNVNPVGLRLSSPGIPEFHQDSTSMTVVGVYDATKRMPGMNWGGATARTNSPTRVYTARGKHWRRDRVLVRTRGPAAAFVSDLRRVLRLRAPSLPVASVMTLEQIDERDYAASMRMAAMAAAGGALALVLASLGLYGVVSLAVRQRTREIGIRIAVGAEPVRVARMFLASGMRAGTIALALGLPLSIVALKVGMAQGAVIAPEANPYLIGGVIAVVLMIVASLATWIPARRSALVDPATTLRIE